MNLENSIEDCDIAIKNFDEDLIEISREIDKLCKERRAIHVQHAAEVAKREILEQEAQRLSSKGSEDCTPVEASGLEGHMPSADLQWVPGPNWDVEYPPIT